jgi:hypothetical protein
MYRDRDSLCSAAWRIQNFSLSKNIRMYHIKDFIYNLVKIIWHFTMRFSDGGETPNHCRKTALYLTIKKILNKRVVNCRVVDLVEYYNFNVDYISIRLVNYLN